MEHIEPITPTESATDSTVAAPSTPAKRPWQTPTCTKFTTEELTKFRGIMAIPDGTTILGS